MSDHIARVSRAGVLSLVVVVLVLTVNAAVRLPCRDVCGSDVGRLYETRRIDRGDAPFFDRDLEYPPLIGLVMYAAGFPFDGALRLSFLLNAALLIALAGATTWVLWRRYGHRVRRWALAPPLLLQGLTNWDLLAVAPATIGLVLWEGGAAWSVGLLLGVAAGAKLFPALYVPILAASALAAHDLRRARNIVLGAFIGVAVFAVPVYARAPSAFRYFLEFHGDRQPTWGTIWFYLFRDPTMTPWFARERFPAVGTVVSTVLVVGLLSVLVVQTYRHWIGPLVACALATIAFVLGNKVYSPQYDLWIVPFLVMLPVRTKLVVHFYVSSTLVFVLSQGVKHVIGPPLFLYFMGAAVLYRFVTLLLIGWDLVAQDRAVPGGDTRQPAVVEYRL